MAQIAGIKDIAEAVGVSPSTVSRVMNGKSCVNEETRQRVLKMVEKMNYQPNPMAQGLKKGRSNMICLIIPGIDNPIFAPITKGVENFARKNGYMTLLCNTEEDESLEIACIDRMKGLQVDGFIMCGGYGNNKRAHALKEEGFPVVLACRFDDEDPNYVDTVGVDNFKSAYNATRYLIRSGRKRIAIASGSEEHYLYRERLRGYREALHEAGMEVDPALVMVEAPGEESSNGFYQMTRELMGLDNPPDAIFASSDPKAFAVIHALHELRIRIPEDVSVMGFDNVSMSAMMQPTLSTLSQPLYEMGVSAAKNLLRQINHKEKTGEIPDPIQTIMNVELVIRQSTD